MHTFGLKQTFVWGVSFLENAEAHHWQCCDDIACSSDAVGRKNACFTFGRGKYFSSHFNVAPKCWDLRVTLCKILSSQNWKRRSYNVNRGNETKCIEKREWITSNVQPKSLTNKRKKSRSWNYTQIRKMAEKMKISHKTQFFIFKH